MDFSAPRIILVICIVAAIATLSDAADPTCSPFKLEQGSPLREKILEALEDMCKKTPTCKNRKLGVTVDLPDVGKVVGSSRCATHATQKECAACLSAAVGAIKHKCEGSVAAYDAEHNCRITYMIGGVGFGGFFGKN